MYKFGPNNFNYVSCDRCFYLLHKLGIQIKGNFPEIFNTLDLKQKDFFINKGTSELSDNLPKGKFFKTVNKVERNKRKKNGLPEFKELEIPATITSKGLKDNKGREYILSGKPDLVTKFEKSFGILDFKTTSEKDKSHNYRFQLESYAQIFENPLDGPTLTPFSHMGLIQFTPANNFKWLKSINQKWKWIFSAKRDKEEFNQFITDRIDVLEQNQIPNKFSECKISNSADKYSEAVNEK